MATSTRPEELQPCPGCGARLPRSTWPVDRRRNASSACWERYTLVLAHEAEEIVRLGRLHQLTVDTYAAQHPGPSVPPIAIPFALIGLHLALDEGWSGAAVRAAHGWLAQRADAWPAFTPPSSFGPLTADRIAQATRPEIHARLVEAWANGTWAAWRPAHERVRDWADGALPHAVRARLQADAGDQLRGRG